MQIYAMSARPYYNAMLLDDRRIVRMCAETSQILSNASRVVGYTKGVPLKATDLEHPCVRWASESMDNFWWLTYQLEEYLHHHNIRLHKLAPSHPAFMHLPFYHQVYTDTPSTPRTPFINNTPIVHENVHHAYCQQLAIEWWEDLVAPRWFNSDGRWDRPGTAATVQDNSIQQHIDDMWALYNSKSAGCQFHTRP